jgi:hypothetical protein
VPIPFYEAKAEFFPTAAPNPPIGNQPPGHSFGPDQLRRGLLIPDRLDMLVTSDPTAELDAALAVATTQLQAARSRGDQRTAERLLLWINTRLDQRNSFTGG